ncbi:D-alanyl-D-alanine carboxypeptidase/D-alanyl-D-alanine-endopeptidase (penicillin-binding protein 4) [Granulicella aggregans]|uniref:D-alanyl-D-alanine carboxypeptidase/D-alanyl-D-alanine-endopeptidase (Penicillin-binding protein 4) n=1 Tax=Granulicella aggregans TaxID=474949 RepID=A0A7W8E3E1_9BACT|nr:D-alanyl-D-alanine carboxypeptidase/D-alanyl-D-alanine-endopeptidase [Granulicella aggregans]MBB5057109.1 D-alanyl-D-alanine carboxypeptidase/D-alanyl-D-alanine-endopeptidase (penicillin-binding protein 4) [Granulicella aggregans]
MPPASLRALILALSLSAIQAPAQDLPTTIATLTSGPAVARANWGIMVTTLDGAPLYALNEKKLFQPASNAKLFTTATALALLNHDTFETRIVGKGHFTGAESLVGNLVIIGDGDANLSGRPIPYVTPPREKPTLAPALRYLEGMADTVAKSGLKTINGDIVGDDTLFPWEPYPIDWSVDDLVWGYGAPVSALTITDNQFKATVTPAALPGTPPTVTLDPAVPYYTLDTSNLTTGRAKSPSHIEFERALGSKLLRIYGSIAVDSPADVEEIAIADPAEYAAVALKAMLEARSISVTGTARAEHRLPAATGSFQQVAHEPVKGLDISGLTGHGRGSGLTSYACDHCDPKTLPEDRLIASHTSVSVEEDITVTNKVSQNLHAELLLHQLGAAVVNDGSTAQGARVIRAFAVQAGVDPNDFIFYDGSGMSGHDLVTPRAIARLLQFATKQPWFADYKASLPIGGVDGSLEHRFTTAPLKGHVFAKTGTLGEARALSGYLDCASGRTVIFSILVGNHDPTTSSDRDVMDKIVATIAAAE